MGICSNKRVTADVKDCMGPASRSVDGTGRNRIKTKANITRKYTKQAVEAELARISTRDKTEEEKTLIHAALNTHFVLQQLTVEMREELVDKMKLFELD